MPLYRLYQSRFLMRSTVWMSLGRNKTILAVIRRLARGGGGSSAAERPGKVMATASAVLRSEGSHAEPRCARSEVSDTESNVSAKSWERTEWYLVEGFAAPEGFNCLGVDASSSITYRAYVCLREAYAIPTSVALLHPLMDDIPFFPRCGFAAVTVVSL